MSLLLTFQAHSKYDIIIVNPVLSSNTNEQADSEVIADSVKAGVMQEVM